MKQRSSVKVGVLYTIAAYILWGLFPIYWKALQNIPADQILAHRIIWACVFVCLLLVFKRRIGDIRIAIRDSSKIIGVVLSGLTITLNWYIYIWAVNNDKVIEASLGYYINPLLVVLIGIILLRERIDGWQVLALILAAIGVLILTLEYGKIPWISLGLATTFAIYSLAKRLVKVDSLLGLALETAVVVPIALLYLGVIEANGGGVLEGKPFSTILLLIGTGVVTAAPLLLFGYAAKIVPFTTIGFIQYLSPTINLLLGVFVFQEEFTITHAWSFGFIWIALGIFSVSRIFMFQKNHQGLRVSLGKDNKN